ncbi:MAG: energy transducer TonB [Phycisphaerales bacterium]
MSTRSLIALGCAIGLHALVFAALAYVPAARSAFLSDRRSGPTAVILVARAQEPVVETRVHVSPYNDETESRQVAEMMQPAHTQATIVPLAPHASSSDVSAAIELAQEMITFARQPHSATTRHVSSQQRLDQLPPLHVDVTTPDDVASSETASLGAISTQAGGSHGPVAVHRPQPRYPESARRVGAEGVVLIEALIDAEGRVADVRVARSSGRASFDRAARTAVSRWRFEPARADGGAVVEQWIELEIEFRLETSER